MLVACSQVTSSRRDNSLLLSRVDDHEVHEGDLYDSCKAPGAQQLAARAALPQVLPGKRSWRLRHAAMVYGDAWTCGTSFFGTESRPGLAWHERWSMVHGVAGITSVIWGMHFLYVICICGTGDNSYIPLPEGTVIPLPEGKVKITLENPAPLLDHHDRGCCPNLPFAKIAWLRFRYRP